MSGANNGKRGFATRAIHSWHESESGARALQMPIYLTSTFTFDDAAHGERLFAGEDAGHFYSRISNPTVAALERVLADLEEGEAALAAASGMAAIAAAMWTLLKSGDRLVADKTLYGCTFALLTHGLAKFGVKVVFADLSDLGEVERAVSPGARMVYLETPANPNMRIIDIAAVSEIAHRYDATVMVDNTYMTPFLQQPLKLGADIVTHSATKFMSGHGDVLGGALIGGHEFIKTVRLEGIKNYTGGALSPLSAFLILRGLKTLPLRMERHCFNAKRAAEFLAAHPQVESVLHPDLPNFPGREIAARQMHSGGAMISFALKGGKPAGESFVNRLRLISLSVSLGNAETLCQHPATMTHAAYTAEERACHGIGEGDLRLAVGLEDADDIIADMQQALA